MANTNETNFYNSLKNIFTGANIEGEGGYINLLKIKSAYCKQILEKLREEISKNPIITGDFKEEFFDRLYSFFEKYFSESGSVYFVKTANWQKVYEKVYTDNKDVVLFWKTNMLYYVKSDILFDNITIEVEDENNKKYSFYFDCGNLQNKQNNEKKELIFIYTKTEKNIYNFSVSYSKSGAKTNIETLSKQTKLSTEIIQKAFNIFKKQNTVDFFINKNAKKFLTEQLDLYLHQILLTEDNIFEQKRLNQLKTVKEFALKIINFISQFEDELVRIWNKPKFVLDSNYVITLDKLSAEIINKISKHKNLKEQIKEWQMLGMVDEKFVFSKRTEEHKHLPVDTKYFKDLEIDILSLFDNLDEALDGRLINSENYQALNTLEERYKEQIQCIYIDPPFNTGTDFDYIDNYQDSSWLTIMYDRLKKSYAFLNDKGGIYVHLDRYANYFAHMLLNNIYGKNNYKAEIYWDTCGNTGFKSSTFWYQNTNCILQYAKNNSKYKFNKLYTLLNVSDPNLSKEERKQKGIGWLDIQKDNNGKNYIEQYENSVLTKKYFDFESKVDPIGMIWTDILSFLYTQVGNNESYFFNSGQKPEHLIARIIKSQTDVNDIVMDFYAGIGTTVAVSHKLHRKYIGIEMGEHFNTFYNSNKKVGIIGRMKHVLKGDSTFFVLNPNSDEKSRRNPQLTRNLNWQGGGFFKYYKLEQYENTLDKVNYNEKTPQIIFDFKRPFENYIFQTDAKLSDVLKVKDNTANVNFDNLYKNIDFAETISLIKGKAIKKITKTGVLLENEKEEIKTDYKNMTNEEKINFIKLLKPLLWWGK